MKEEHGEKEKKKNSLKLISTFFFMRREGRRNILSYLLALVAEVSREWARRKKKQRCINLSASALFGIFPGAECGRLRGVEVGAVRWSASLKLKITRRRHRRISSIRFSKRLPMPGWDEETRVPSMDENWTVLKQKPFFFKLIYVLSSLKIQCFILLI